MYYSDYYSIYWAHRSSAGLFSHIILYKCTSFWNRRSRPLLYIRKNADWKMKTHLKTLKPTKSEAGFHRFLTDLFPNDCKFWRNRLFGNKIICEHVETKRFVIDELSDQNCWVIVSLAATCKSYSWNLLLNFTLPLLLLKSYLRHDIQSLPEFFMVYPLKGKIIHECKSFFAASLKAPMRKVNFRPRLKNEYIHIWIYSTAHLWWTKALSRVLRIMKYWYNGMRFLATLKLLTIN